MHQPMLPAAHQPGPKPPGPAVTPTRRQSAPRTPSPPRTNPGTVRPPGWQPTSAGTGIPSSAACSRQKTAPKSHQYPSRPRPQPQRRTPQETHPREPPGPRPQRHHANNKTTAGQNRDPTHTRWRSWSKGPREIDLMWQQKLCQD